MSEQPIQYAVLRDQRHWDESAKRAGLAQQEDGTLTLARLPGTLDGKPIVVPNGAPLDPSGLALGDCQELFVADTAYQRIIRLDSLCNARAMLPGVSGGGSAPGQFKDPRGLLIANDSLYVADSGNRRIQVFRLPSLELRAIWEDLLEEPSCLAADSQGRIYVLDSKLNGILRFSPAGVPDEVYNIKLAQNFTDFKLARSLAGLDLVSLAVDGNNMLYIAHKQSDEIVRIDSNNQRLAPILGDKPGRPGVMTARGDWLYVADQAGGEIWAFDCNAGLFLGELKDYRGPVTALALDQAGALYIKPGPDDTFHHLQAAAAYAPLGILTAGPFDAGMESVWERVHAELDLPDGTQAELHLFTAGTSVEKPAPDVYSPALALDTLVKPSRFLWLRVTLHSDDRRRASPVLKQVQAETTAESYMNHLPAVYRRDDAPTRFLEHWLALFRAELGDLELALEEMPRRFDPLNAPEADLPWLAAWLAFNPPADLHGDELRTLFQRVPALYDRRGTPFGICEFVELYTGVRPSIFEAFRERHIWQLGYTSTLGFDTALAAGLPDGMIVPGYALADPQYFGLRGEYYNGIDFQAHRLTRTDPNVDFDWGKNSPDSLVSKNGFSVRWTGQILPRYSERYTFHVRSDDGVRLFIDGVLIIDKWIDQPPPKHTIDQSPPEHTSVISLELEAGRWYSIQLEYYEKAGVASIKLSWSSRTQLKEIIPQSRLYSVRDEAAQLEPSPSADGAASILVGQTIVGESGPLEKDDFGMPLFSETAHLFTVTVPAGALQHPAQREMLQRVVEAEKPAHTDYHLCFVEPRMRVGFQARLGIDSIVAGPPEPLALTGSVLGVESYLGKGAESGRIGQAGSRVGQSARLGQDTHVT